MKKRKKQLKLERLKKRRRGIPCLYKNRVYFGKKLQKGIGAISKVIASLLGNVGDVIGL